MLLNHLNKYTNCALHYTMCGTYTVHIQYVAKNVVNYTIIFVN